ncbi:hypothetical protein AAIH46_21245 [Rhizobium sp. 0TCS1.26]|uniref:hypothetical protein n=1 Tax=Rhizobium sp. 0TCS1.26 TaxID=3142623 RepID=UPI003D266372
MLAIEMGNTRKPFKSVVPEKCSRQLMMSVLAGKPRRGRLFSQPMLTSRTVPPKDPQSPGGNA